jgi:hypothetical protein
MISNETISHEHLIHIIKKFQKQGFEGLKPEDLAIAVS